MDLADLFIWRYTPLLRGYDHFSLDYFVVEKGRGENWWKAERGR